MENPRQNLPRLLNSAMIITISSFTLVVITFYLCLPLEVIRANNALALVSSSAQDFRSISRDICAYFMRLSCRNLEKVF